MQVDLGTWDLTEAQLRAFHVALGKDSPVGAALAPSRVAVKRCLRAAVFREVERVEHAYAAAAAAKAGDPGIPGLLAEARRRYESGRP